MEESTARRWRYIRFYLQDLGQQPPDLFFASNVYYQAVLESAPPIDPTSKTSNRFIAAMFELAKGDTFALAIDWQRQFRKDLDPSRPVQWLEIEDRVNGFLDSLRQRLRLFLTGPLIRPWEPPASWQEVMSPGASVNLYDHLRSLNIPLNPLVYTTRNGQELPDLLLYKLAEFSMVDGGQLEHRLSMIIGTGEHNATLVNTSGAGKTRILLEILSKNWGFYFTCIWIRSVSPYGSTDIYNNTHPDYLCTLRTEQGQSFHAIGTDRSEEAYSQLATNVLIVHAVTDLIILARLLVWGIFLEVYHEMRAHWQREHDNAPQSILPPEARAKRAWVILQTFPRLDDSGQLCGTDDMFHQLVLLMSRLSTIDRTVQITAAKQNITKYGINNPTYLVFDEVQSMASELHDAFPSTAEGATRPLLKPVVQGIYRWFESARIFVAGTRLYREDIDSALVSSVMKNRPNLVFSKLGGYFRDEDIMTVLYHFFTKSFVDSWAEDIRRDLLFWFRGRHRFLSIFIQWVLKEGPREHKIRNVIKNIIYHATEADNLTNIVEQRAFTRLPMTIRSIIPQIFPRFGEIIPFEVEDPLIRRAREAVMTFMCFGTTPQFGDDCVELVEEGIGIFFAREDSHHLLGRMNGEQSSIGDAITEETKTGIGAGTVKICERLVLAGLMNYFTHPLNPFSIREAVRYNLSPDNVGTGTGTGFERAMVHIFWDVFSHPDGAVLSDIFDFTFVDPAVKRAQHRTPRVLDLTPDWASYKAHLIGSFDFGSTSSPRHPRRVEHWATSRLAVNASGYKDVLQWFWEHCNGCSDDLGTPPFIFSSVHCGPDILFALELEHPTDPTAPRRYLLVSVSCKNWDIKQTIKNGEPRSKGGAEVRDALFTMSPEGFFSKMDEKSTAKPAAISAIRSYLANFPPITGNKRPPEPAADDDIEMEMSEDNVSAVPLNKLDETVVLKIPRSEPEEKGRRMTTRSQTKSGSKRQRGTRKNESTTGPRMPTRSSTSSPQTTSSAIVSKSARPRRGRAAAAPVNMAQQTEHEPPQQDEEEPPKQKRKVKHIKYPYADKVEFGVMRCLAAFPGTVRLPPMTTAEGLYPLATLTHNVIRKGHYIGFDEFRQSLARLGEPTGPTATDDARHKHKRTELPCNQHRLEDVMDVDLVEPSQDTNIPIQVLEQSTQNTDDSNLNLESPNVADTLQQYLFSEDIDQALANNASQQPLGDDDDDDDENDLDYIDDGNDDEGSVEEDSYDEDVAEDVAIEDDEFDELEITLSIAGRLRSGRLVRELEATDAMVVDE